MSDAEKHNANEGMYETELIEKLEVEESNLPFWYYAKDTESNNAFGAAHKILCK